MSLNTDYSSRARVADAALQPLGFEQLTGISASKGLQSIPEGAIVQNVRWRDDGVAPTATVGIQLKAEAMMTYNGDLDALRFIEETASGVVNVSYYR